MSWRGARSLFTFRNEFNDCFPGRPTASDGMLGDAAHASRDSDHNPWIEDPPGPNVVSAIDVTKGSAPGIPDTIQWAFDVLVKRRDRRVKYLIHNGLMCRSYPKDGIPAWTWVPYTGPNPHMKHGHLSVWDSKKLYDSTAPWGLVAALKEEDDMPSPKDWDDKDWAAIKRFGIENATEFAKAVVLTIAGRSKNLLEIVKAIATKVGVK